MRALVIGGSGFIGRHLVDQLLQQGYAVRATYRRTAATLLLPKRRVQLVRASLQEPEALAAAMRGCAVVFMAAGYYPRYSLDLQASIEEGVRGVRNACEAALAAAVPRFVYTSSTGSLETFPARPSNEDDVPVEMPVQSVYRAVKWAMEREVEAAARRGLSTVTLLPGGCIGAGDFRLGTGGLFVAAVRGQLPFWLDGQVNLVAVEDVARAQLAAVRAPGARYCIAPHNVAFGALLQSIVARYGGVVPEQISAAEAVLRADSAERAAAPHHARVAFPRELVDVIAQGGAVDCSRARRELGLHFTSLATALDRAHTFFQRVGYLPRAVVQEGTLS